MNDCQRSRSEEIIEESSTPVNSPPIAAVETSSSTCSIPTKNPQSGSVKMAAANFSIPPPAKKISKENAKRAGRFGRGDVHHV